MRRLFGMRGARVDTSEQPTDALALGIAPVRTPRDVIGQVVDVESRETSDNVPAVVVIMRDDAGERTKLIWLGRRRIRGVDVGARLRARGLAAVVKTLPTIYNPRYDLLPQETT